MRDFPYQTAETESVPCDLCTGTEVQVMSNVDRNGLSVRSCICKHCGLIYLNPRMTEKWYGEYYKHEYRAQMARFKHKPSSEPDYDRQFANLSKHGRGLASRIQPHWKPGLTVEVGSSVGGVLNGLRESLGVEVIGIEPSPSEAAQANRRGVRTFTASIESFQEQLPPAANILSVQSLNHFLYPRTFLAWAHQNLQPEGHLVLEVMNFRHVWRHFGWKVRAVQIDHTFMFVPEVLAAFVSAAGFEVVHLDIDETKTKEELRQLRRSGLPRFHIHLVARRAAKDPFADSGSIPSQYAAVLSSFRGLPNSRGRYFLKFEARRRFKAALRRLFFRNLTSK